MKTMREKHKEIRHVEGAKKPRHVFELWEHIGRAKAKKVGKAVAAKDSMLAVYKNCITYTFSAACGELP